MNCSAAARCLTGLVRRNNEDNFSMDGDALDLKHTDSPLVCRTFADRSPHLFGVFDGMGGHRDGEMASFLAASTVAECIPELSGSNPAQVLTEFCLKANDKVCTAADGSQMGTTCALLCLKGDRFTVCNVGDSPVFLIRKGTIRQLSMDHNQRATYERVTGKPARPGQKFPLTQCLGIPKEEMLIEPYVTAGKAEKGDIFLLCSDGITDMLGLDMLLQVCVEDPSPEKIASTLTQKAMAAGGKDNATLICVCIHQVSVNGLTRVWKRLIGK